ncbi:MAG: (2Fe-2S)-binding protein [Pseudomonadota bacterium]
MIVCSCNIIRRAEIESAILDLLEQDPWKVIVPLQVYHSLEKRGKCCGCFPNVVGIIVEQTTLFHERVNSPKADVIALLDRVQRKYQRAETADSWSGAVTIKSRAA